MLKDVNIDAQKISQLLPHSYPFLLVDKVESYETNKIICKKNVSLNEPFFQGHFPGNPIVPGVLMIEMAAQSAALMYILDSVDYEHIGEDDVNNLFEDNHLSQMVGYIAAVKGFKFQQIVRPGATLSIHCQKTHEIGLLSEVTVMLYDDNQKIVCKGRILVSKNEN